MCDMKLNAHYALHFFNKLERMTDRQKSKILAQGTQKCWKYLIPEKKYKLLF
jgi:hypothetical protein